MSPARSFDRYPVLLDVSGRLAVVVGATKAAERMAVSMAAHGADVVVITGEASASLVDLEAEGVLTVEQRGYVRGDLADAFIAIAASGSPEIDAAVREEARAAGVLVSVAADADASDFTVPAVVERGPLQIAVSTGGIAPAVNKRVRREIAATYGPEWGIYTALLGAVRTRAIQQFGVGDVGLKPLFDSIAGSDLLDRIRAGEDPSADEVMEQNAAAMEPEAEVGEENS
jgi:precorrin-2 dehydrogenase/sirohydrochlorin ferrochelatase